MFYYLTEKIRIKTDPFNYIPEILRKVTVTDEEGNVTEEKLVWTKYGYYSTMAGAVKQIARVYPSVVTQEENKEYTSIKKCLMILNKLKSEIVVKVLSEVEVEGKEEEEDVKPKTKRKNKRTE